MAKISFRDFYSYSFVDLYNSYIKSGLYSPSQALRNARVDVRMYASLFTRDARKLIICSGSSCVKCGSQDSLELDHVIPIVLKGKNDLSNIQVLCYKCHKAKTATEKKYKFLIPINNED